MALQHTATHCNTLQHTAQGEVHSLQKEKTNLNGTLSDTLQHHTATHCNALQHIATHYNTLQHTAQGEVHSLQKENTNLNGKLSTLKHEVSVRESERES